MALDSLGYFGVRAHSLDDWSSFGEKFLGLQLVDRSRKTLTFRMDDRRQRIVVHEDDVNDARRAAFIGWEVADAAALDRLAASLEAARVAVERMPRAVADERRVKDLIAFTDPAGNRLEAFHGSEIATEPFRPGRAISGFRTGPLGMGHVVLNVDNIEQLRPFYTQTLGFHLSDFTLRPFKAYFFHLNPRHHSFAMVETGRSSVHHLMMELFMLDDVGQAYDLAQGEEGRVATTLGRHSNDFITSFYANSPSGFFVEYGWGGRSIDPGTWTPVEMTCGPSLWGHDRTWLSPEGRAQARALRLHAADEGMREPVQVIEGNYTLAPGTCLWWDAARKGTTR
ncbi:MAG TPA: VOC family protein [Vicinamibacterales bacterium]|nr:VOC family protein [Vicinamibacterales bacterium]